MTAILLVVLMAVATLASYIGRIYAEFGKILPREVQDNLDAWEDRVEPHLGLTRDHAGLCAAVLEQLTLGLIALDIGDLFLFRLDHAGAADAVEISEALLAIILVVMVSNQLIPTLLFNRTRGDWAVHILWPIRALLWMVTPITVFIRFFTSIASLADHPVGAETEPAADVDALIEAGEEEGILEKSDRELVRSAVEFGDKLVRELMTPRPQVFAVPGDTTLERFLEMLHLNNYSRVPVYSGTIDNVTGIAFAHDLLQISDDEARHRTVSSIQRPAVFVPETKHGYELLREMQRDKQHMCVVVDEYGSMAGVVTIENLLEEIVGEIRDEHETDPLNQEPQKESTGAWLVSGSLPADELSNLFGEPVDLNEEYEAATVGGLVSEIEGRIPLPGEVIELEPAGLRMEVVAATDHRVERVRVFPPSATHH